MSTLEKKTTAKPTTAPGVYPWSHMFESTKTDDLVSVVDQADELKATKAKLKELKDLSNSTFDRMKKSIQIGDETQTLLKQQTDKLQSEIRSLKEQVGSLQLRKKNTASETRSLKSELTTTKEKLAAAQQQLTAKPKQFPEVEFCVIHECIIVAKNKMITNPTKRILRGVYTWLKQRAAVVQRLKAVNPMSPHIELMESCLRIAKQDLLDLIDTYWKMFQPTRQ